MNANEVALVTGGNKGIGREIVHRLAQQGFVVYLGARSPERGHAAVEELKKESATVRGGRPTEKPAGVDADLGRGGGGLDIRFVQLDVTDPGSVEAAVNKIETEAGRLDVLVNNAGIMVEWGVQTADITAAQLREVYEVNVFGIVTVTSACVPLLRRSHNPRIVNMSSGLGSLTILSDPTSPFLDSRVPRVQLVQGRAQRPNADLRQCPPRRRHQGQRRQPGPCADRPECRRDLPPRRPHHSR
jgi:NAD(P)-dependent dehydrogenase (short-subunit alcohol dehydrogenase family)